MYLSEIVIYVNVIEDESIGIVKRTLAKKNINHKIRSCPQAPEERLDFAVE